jgi:hypothetical protein
MRSLGRQPQEPGHNNKRALKTPDSNIPLQQTVLRPFKFLRDFCDCSGSRKGF